MSLRNPCGRGGIASLNPSYEERLGAVGNTLPLHANAYAVVALRRHELTGVMAIWLEAAKIVLI
ncbi:hypothetical protein [Pseudomonas citronellolis]|uniref:hypothetical protein n=1 Tax=Pseudomonas citronellolis TaxID=53408 RepID=UPI000AB21BB7|nr:hypothetical protein [Pseudomonas humi]